MFALMRVFATMACVAMLGCGSAETYDGPDGVEHPTSSSTVGPVCAEADPAVAGPDAACGVFVSSSLGSDDNPGTLEQPVRTMARALALAMEGQGRVYACAELFEEAAEVPAGVELRGGLDCAQGWGYVGSSRKTTIAPGASGVIALRVLGGEGSTRVVDVHAEAASGEQPGESSIAALVEPGAAAVIERSALVAGNGAAGAEGEKGGGAGAPERAMDGADGLDGGDACGVNVVPGGAAVVTVCDGVETIGGKGGNGRVTYGDAGEDGQPIPANPDGVHGEGGFGQDSTHISCMSGANGHGGRDGEDGLGAVGPGHITIAGWEGVKGQDGTNGLPGQGGGGGGGARGPLYTECGAGVAKGGASGGSGGAAGCGGKGAKGGGSGGASIGLVSLSGEVTIQDTAITAGNGGDGGRGGLAQWGGSGGDAGNGGYGWYSGQGCPGGSGGKGGNGGLGGGGLGGPTLGIAHVEGQPVIVEGITISVGTGGEGGPGGSPFVTLPGTDGEDGLEAETKGFPIP